MEPEIQQILEHISVLNGEMGGVEFAQRQIAIDVAVLKTQMSGLMFWFKGFAGAFILFFATQIWQVGILKKNGKK